MQNLAIILLDYSKEVESRSGKDIADASVVTTINEMFTTVPVEERIINCSQVHCETTPKNKLAMFKD